MSSCCTCPTHIPRVSRAVRCSSYSTCERIALFSAVVLGTVGQALIICLIPTVNVNRLKKGYDIDFSINGVKHVVTDKFPPTTTLNDYIRDVAGLKGTKVMCKEGGCGCCAVTVTRVGNSFRAETVSINSCLCPLYGVDGWQISTVEGIGNVKEGFHPIQARLAKYNGTQCGYCSPGFVMSLYGLLHQRPNATKQEIEDSFDGHICRCTGYRSILDAMKSFGSDSASGEKCLDIEDLNKHLCPKTGELFQKKDIAPQKSLDIDLYESKWYRPLNLLDLARIMQQHKDHSTILVHGNTASGIFKNRGPFEVYIDLKSVYELHIYEEIDQGVLFGGGITLTQFKERLGMLKKKAGFHYCDKVIKHLKEVASNLIRNAGTIGGNLMTKYAHPDFPSDLFTLLEAIGASVQIYGSASSLKTEVTLLEFFQTIDMKGKVLLSISMPKWEPTDYYQSFKVSPRSQNAHAYVNAAFKIPVENRRIISQPNIVVGGISAKTVHAEKTESYLTGKLLDNNTIKEALNVMYLEMEPTEEPLLASPKYRKELAVNLLYKTLLEVYKSRDCRLQSGAGDMERSLSCGSFTFQEKPSDYPIKQPMPKKTASLQTSGEAQFINDIPIFKQEMAAAFFVSTVSSGNIRNIDATEALNIPGVIKYVGVSDLTKGQNNNYLPEVPGLGKFMHEELFATKEVVYCGQPVGIILAETTALAEQGAQMVKVSYEDVREPTVDLQDAIVKKNFLEVHPYAERERVKGDISEAFKKCTHIVESEVKQGTQYHAFLETVVALSVPSEDGIDIYANTQWQDYLQRSVAHVLGKPLNYINVVTPRIGGAFGNKIFQVGAAAAAAALCTELTGRPVRINLDLSVCMKMTGKRFPFCAKYKAGCDADGKMKAVELDISIDSGCQYTFPTDDLLLAPDQGFFIPNWKIRIRHFKTNKAGAHACRGPGAVVGCLINETIMEHMAQKLGMNSILFKEINLYAKGQNDISDRELTYCCLKDMWELLKETAEVPSRMNAVDKFNQNNKWRKRGLTMSTIKYGMHYLPGTFPTSVSVFAGDGTVTVTTSGVEMGQGLYTKVAQAVARTLGVSVDQVKVRPNQNNLIPNTPFTGASVSSERCVASAIAACEKINQGLQSLREKMANATFPELLTAAVFSNVPLYATVGREEAGPLVRYYTYLVGAAETEVDVLTGQYQVKRVDIMADYGESLNPTIDLGQTEGAFVMGLGAYLTEDVIYDPKTGQLLNDGTWEYKPPTTKDIPIAWRIHFLKNNPNPAGVLGSKGTGEPAIGLGAGVLMSIKQAVEAAREELKDERAFIPTVAPFTVEKIQQAAGVQLKHLQV